MVVRGHLPRLVGAAALFSLAQPALCAAPSLEEIVVVGHHSQVDLVEVYAGGQLARGGRVGLLGNVDFLDSPFAGQSYTSALVAAQQAESVGALLANDPVVRVAKGFGNFQEVYLLRGFPLYSDDITLNGLYGILPRQSVAAELFERVEVLRGANAFVNGATPGGSGVGGAVNLVPKRATELGNSELTWRASEGGQHSLAVDVGQRLGDDQRWGVRLNAVGRDGDSVIDRQSGRFSAAALGLDYRGEQLRVAADIGWQQNRLDAPRPQLTPLAALPAVPAAERNYAQPWTFADEQQLFAALRGEYQFSAALSGWLAFGGRSGEEQNRLANPSSDAEGNLTAYRFDNSRFDNVVAADGGLRGVFKLGGVSHAWVVSAAEVELRSRNAYAFSNFAGFNSDLYAPQPVAMPAADFFVGGQLQRPLRTEQSNQRSVAVADTVELLDGKLLVTAGLRHQTIDNQTFDYNSGAELSSYKDSITTPAVGVVLRLAPPLSLYANYAESLQPGSVVPATSGGVALGNAGQLLDPFASEQVEVGVKYDRDNWAVTAALFELAKPNLLLVDNRLTDNGEQRSRGLELSLFGEPLPGWRVIAGATYLDAELSATQAGLNQGNRPIGIAELQANLNLEWQVAAIAGLTVDARWVYTGEQMVDEANTIQLPSWQRLDLGARYQFAWAGRDMSVAARLENASNASDWISAGGYPGANYLIQGGPRTLSVAIKAAF